jgi:ribosomal protein L35
MLFKLKNKSAIKKRIRVLGNGNKIKFARSKRRHGMMQANRSKLHQKKGMAVATKADHQWHKVIKSLV